MPVTHDYVEQRGGDYWVTGTQVSLNSLVQVFHHGAAPTTIARFCPALSIEQVYGAIIFYLTHRAEIGSGLKRNAEGL
jgi:uncharacterized protein (DUF433 family)